MSGASQRASERGPRADSCSHDGCSRDDGLVERRLTGSEYIGAYCEDHDPLEDPAVSGRYEEIDAGQGGAA